MSDSVEIEWSDGDEYFEYDEYSVTIEEVEEEIFFEFQDSNAIRNE